MTRDEMIENAAWEIVKGRNGANCLPWARLPEVHQRPYRGDVNAVLSAIEAAGLCIVPREATEAIEDAMLVTGLVEEGSYQRSPSDCAQTVYRAMIEAGKL